MSLGRRVRRYHAECDEMIYAKPLCNFTDREISDGISRQGKINQDAASSMWVRVHVYDKPSKFGVA